jgi:hypothetical protein
MEIFPYSEYILSYWIVPVGMLALYFYGNFHFNTPEYLLDIGLQGDQAAKTGPGAA